MNTKEQDRNDVAVAATKLKESAKELGGTVSTMAKNFVERDVPVMKDKAVAAAKDAKETTVAKTKEVTAATETFVKEKPWKAVGIAAAVGALVGVLIKRK